MLKDLVVISIREDVKRWLTRYQGYLQSKKGCKINLESTILELIKRTDWYKEDFNEIEKDMVIE